MRAAEGGRAVWRGRLWRPAAVLLALCLVGSAAAYVLGRLPAPFGLAAHHAHPALTAARTDFGARIGPAPAATPDAQLAQARAIVAPAATPVRLRVPSISVDAAVETVGEDAQERMATPSRADDVAWFGPGVRPGDAGDSVMAGHLDWTTGPAVFWRLGQVRGGAQVSVLRSDGSQAVFLVDSTSTMPYDAPTDSLFTRDGPPSLTLITCAGAWDQQRGTYLQRLVVHAALAPNIVPGG